MHFFYVEFSEAFIVAAWCIALSGAMLVLHMWSETLFECFAFAVYGAFIVADFSRLCFAIVCNALVTVYVARLIFELFVSMGFF